MIGCLSRPRAVARPASHTLMRHRGGGAVCALCAVQRRAVRHDGEALAAAPRRARPSIITGPAADGRERGVPLYDYLGATTERLPEIHRPRLRPAALGAVLALAFAGLWWLWRSPHLRHATTRAVQLASVRNPASMASALAGGAGRQLLVAVFGAPTMFGFWFPGRHLLARCRWRSRSWRVPGASGTRLEWASRCRP